MLPLPTTTCTGGGFSFTNQAYTYMHICTWCKIINDLAPDSRTYIGAHHSQVLLTVSSG